MSIKERNLNKMKAIMEDNQKLYNEVSGMKFREKKLKERLIKNKQ